MGLSDSLSSPSGEDRRITRAPSSFQIREHRYTHLMGLDKNKVHGRNICFLQQKQIFSTLKCYMEPLLLRLSCMKKVHSQSKRDQMNVGDVDLISSHRNMS